MEMNGGDRKKKIVVGEAGYVLEDVPHLSDYIPDLPVTLRALSFHFILFPKRCIVFNLTI